MKTQIPSEILSKIVELHSQGVPHTEIEQQTGILTDTFRYHLKKKGLLIGPKQTHKLDESNIERILELAKKGVRGAELARIFGVSKTSISYILKKNGVATDIFKSLLPPKQPKRSRIRYSKDQIFNVVELRKSGMDRREISNITQVSLAKIKRILADNLVELDKETAQKNVNAGKIARLEERLFRRSGVKTIGDLMQQYAKRHEGEWIGEYVNNRTKALWKCKKGHEFEMIPNSVQQGQWCPRCSHVGPSVGQLEILEFVKQLVPDLEVRSCDRQAIGPKELDIYVPALNQAFEYNGLLHHSEYFGGEEVRNRHIDKYRACRQAGIGLLAVFSDEWINKKDLICSMIASRLNRAQTIPLDARKLELKRLDKNEQFEQFFEANHLDGHARASFAYGLFNEFELVACASVRTNHQGETELARLATDKRFNVRGGAGRLIKAIKNEIDSSLVSFSNNRVGSGQIYRTLGFQLVAENKPSYWYTDGAVRLWRYRCRRINDPGVLSKFPTEKSQALAGVFSGMYLDHERPLFRIWDYGHAKWLLE